MRERRARSRFPAELPPEGKVWYTSTEGSHLALSAAQRERVLQNLVAQGLPRPSQYDDTPEMLAELAAAAAAAATEAKAGGGVTQLRLGYAAAGFSTAEVRAVEHAEQRSLYSYEELIQAIVEVKTAGCSAAKLREAGFSSSELRAAEFTLAELKGAGYGAAELKETGFPLNKLRLAGFSAPSSAVVPSQTGLVPCMKHATTASISAVPDGGSSEFSGRSEVCSGSKQSPAERQAAISAGHMLSSCSIVGGPTCCCPPDSAAGAGTETRTCCAPPAQCEPFVHAKTNSPGSVSSNWKLPVSSSSEPPEKSHSP